jgi:GntR family transcriptional regulator
MRMALSRLVADDLIMRRAGKGTTVLPLSDRLKFYLDRSFTRQMTELGQEAHSKALEVIPGTIGPDSPAAFKKKVGAPCLKLVRLRFGDDEPIAIQSTTVLTESCPDLTQHNFDQESLYQILAREYRLIIVEIQHSISATLAGKYQAELLQISESDPLLVVKTAAYLENKQILEDTVSYYRADKYEYRTAHQYTP